MGAAFKSIEDVIQNNVTSHSVAGPERIISDGLFSVIIFIYVSVTFLYTFYAFCFRNVEKDDSKQQAIKNHIDEEVWQRIGEKGESNKEKKTMKCG